jgi:hypothetical protein
MTILLVSALRDEGPHVLEWIAHHRSIGVTDFLLFTNDCADGTDAMLDALGAFGAFGVVHEPNPAEPGKSVQWSALKAAWDHPLRKRADWILCIDSDEFVNLTAPLNSLQDLIAQMGEADAITLPWRLFGHNGQARLTDAPTCATFTRCAPLGCAYPVGARQFKTLFRAKGPFRQIGVHRPRLKKDQTAVWLDASGAQMPPEFATAEQRLTLFGFPETAALVQLNHYSVRSAESFMVKRARGLPNRRGKPIDLTYWVERNFNTIEETSIARFEAGTAAILGQMMQVPGLRDLHVAAHANYHASFEAILRDEASLKLFGRLLLAATSVPLPHPVISELVHRYQNVTDDDT